MQAPTERAAIEFARTQDLWDLALHHYPGSRADLPPVVLCGGYACNRYFVDYDDDYSLARYLAQRGFDAWVVELRGRGCSEPVRGSRWRGWTFDDLVRYDVPAVLSHVRARSANRSPVWIGHSMGGMVMYAALGQDPALGAATAGLVTLGSPVAFPPAASSLARTLGTLLLAMPLPRHLPQQRVLTALWSVISHAPRAAEVGMNPANIDRGVFGAALRRFICNVPRSKLRQFIHWSLTGTFCSRDAAIDYRRNLSRITIPTLVIAGAADRLASPDVVGYAYDRIRSPRKRYREFAARLGDHADYGHVDLIFGLRAPDEVFPCVSGWIEQAIAEG